MKPGERITKRKLPDNLIRDSSVVKIFQRPYAVLRFMQTCCKVPAGQIVDRIHILSFLFPPDIRGGPVCLRNWDISAPRQCFYRFGERTVFNFLYKTEYIPAGMTAIAVKKLTLFINGKRRRLFPVERAAGPIVTPLFL